MPLFFAAPVHATHEPITVDGNLQDLIDAIGRNTGGDNGGFAQPDPLGEIYTDQCAFVNGFDVENYYFLLDFKESDGSSSSDPIFYGGWEVFGIIGDVDGDESGDPAPAGCAPFGDAPGIGPLESYTVEFDFTCEGGSDLTFAVKDDKVSVILPIARDLDAAQAEFAVNGSMLELRVSGLQSLIDELIGSGDLPQDADLCNAIVTMTANAELDGPGEDRNVPPFQLELPPSIAVTKTPDKQTVCPDSPVVWTISVTNDGPCILDTVTLTDVLDAGMTYVSSSPTRSSGDAQQSVWDLTDLEPGETRNFTLNAMTGSTCTGQLANNVTAEGTHTPPPTCSAVGRGTVAMDDAFVNCVCLDCIITVTPPTPVCAGTPTELCGPDGADSYLWTFPDLSTQTGQCINLPSPTVNSSGVYKLTITSGGSSASCETVLEFFNPPLCAIAGPDTVCAGEPVVLCGPVGNYSYAWTLPNGDEMTGQCITVAEAIGGVYTLIVTDNETGCMSEPCTLDLKVRKRPPCAIAGPEAVCVGERAQICGPVGDYSYVWTKPNGGSVTTRCITIDPVTAADGGTYSLIITDNVTGCEGEPCTYELKVTDPPPCEITADPSGPDHGVSALCIGDPLELCGPQGDYNYRWTLPGGSVVTDRCINIASATTGDAGTYTLVVSDKASGCDSEPCTWTVTVGDPPPCEITPDPTGPITVGNPVSMCGPDGNYTYKWTLPDGSMTTDQCVSITSVQKTDAGVYTLIVTDKGGCASEPCSYELMVDNLVCDLVLEKTVEPDVIVPQPGRDCDDIGKPHTLTFRYTGDDCSATSHNQDPSKVDCFDFGALTGPVTVVYTGKDPGDFSVSPSGPINAGDEVTITAIGRDRFHSETEVEIRDGSGNKLQELRFHTSCSQPLAIGDQYGALFLLGINDVTGGSNEVTYTYVVTNNGTPLVNLELTDDKLGTIASGFTLDNGESRTFTKTAAITQTTTNVATVTGNQGDVSGPTCTATDKATVTVDVPPVTCEDGKPRMLVFEYTGDDCSATTNDQSGRAKCSDHGTLGQPVEIVYVGSDPNEFTVSPVGEVINIGDRWSIAATGRDKFESNSEFEIRQGGQVLQKLEIHTSCSKPLNVGDQFGSLILREFHITLMTAATPTGNDVEVQLGNASLSFEHVMEAGTTSLSYGAVAPDLPYGLVAVGNDALNITTTASFVGDLNLTVDYDPSGLTVPENALRLLHYDRGVWEEITTAIDESGNRILGSCDGLSSFVVAAPLSALSADEPAVPGLFFGIRSSYPNPTEGKTTIRYALSRPGAVRLTVHDVQGRQVATLDSGHFGAGEHTAVWNGRSVDGRALAAGIYVIRLEAAEGLRTAKIAKMK